MKQRGLIITRKKDMKNPNVNQDFLLPWPKTAKRFNFQINIYWIKELKQSI